MALKSSSRVNNKLHYRGPGLDELQLVVNYQPAPEYPTFDTYRVKWDSTQYTWDNDGDEA